MIVIHSKRSLTAPVTVLLLVLVAVSASLILVHTIMGLGEAKESEEGPTNALVIEDVVDGALIVRNVGWREAEVSALYVLEPVEKRMLAAFRYEPPLPIAPLESREVPIPSDISSAADRGEMVLYVIRSTQAAAEARLGPFLPQTSSGGSSGSVLGLPSGIGTVLWLSGTSGSTLVAFTYNDTTGYFHTLVARGDSGTLSIADWNTSVPRTLFEAYQTPTIPVWGTGGNIVVLGTTPLNASGKAATLIRLLDPQSLATKSSLQVLKKPTSSTSGTEVVELGGLPGLPEVASPMAAAYDEAFNTLYWIGITSVNRTNTATQVSETHLANYAARLDLSTLTADYIIFWVPLIPGTPNWTDFPPLMPTSMITPNIGLHDNGLVVLGNKLYAMGGIIDLSAQFAITPGILVMDKSLSRIEQIVLLNSTLLNATRWNSLYFLRSAASQLVLAGDGYVSTFVGTVTPGSSIGCGVGGQGAVDKFDYSAPLLIALDPNTFDVTYASVFGISAMGYTTSGVASSSDLVIQMLAPVKCASGPLYDMLLVVHDVAQKKVLAIQNLTLLVDGSPLATVYSTLVSGAPLVQPTPAYVDLKGDTLILTIANLNTAGTLPSPESIVQLQVPLDRFLALKPGDAITLVGSTNITLVINPNTAALNQSAAQTQYTTSNLISIISDPENLASQNPLKIEKTIDSTAIVTSYTPPAVLPPFLALSESQER